MTYIRDSNGNESFTVTLSIVAFVIVMLKVLLSGASIAFGSFAYSFGAIDSLSIGAVLAPVLGTYAARRHTEAKYGGESDAVTEDSGAKPHDGAL